MTSSPLKFADLSHFSKTRHVTLRDVNAPDSYKLSESVYFHEIVILSKIQVNLIIFDKVMAICRFSHISRYFSYFRMFRHVNGHIFQKNDRIELKFIQIQDFSKVNIF